MALHVRTLHHNLDRYSYGFVIIAQRIGSAWVQIPLPLLSLPSSVQRFAGELDVYLSIGQFRRPRRRMRDLQALVATIVDLDIYRSEELRDLSPLRALDRVLRTLEEGGMPLPTLTVFSGRGFHLYWVHSPLPPQAYPRWSAVVHHLVQYLAPLGADPVAVDPTRVLRLVGTVHSKTGAEVELIAPVRPPLSFEELARKVLPIPREELEQRRRASGRRGRRVFLVDPSAHLTPRELWWNRLDAIEFLIQSRYFLGGLPPGNRDRYLFLRAVGWSWILPLVYGLLWRTVREDAWVWTHGAWDDRETYARVSAVLKRAKAVLEGEEALRAMQYRFTEERIIEMLQITPEEQEAIFRRFGKPILCGEEIRKRYLREKMRRYMRHYRREVEGRVSREAYEAERRRRVRELRAKVLALRAQGKSLREIAEELGVSIDWVRDLLYRGKGV